MKVIQNLKDVRSLEDSPARRSMQRMAQLCHLGEEGGLLGLEEDFDTVLGGEWYLVEHGDDPRNLILGRDDVIDLFSDEWNWCDLAVLQDGCFTVFWGVNNAGGPCLYVPDEEWLSAEFRGWLLERVAESKVPEGVNE